MGDQAKRPRGRPRSFNRERAVEFALHNYWDKGLDQSLNEVCRQAEISKPTLYREFGGEDELLAAALELYRERRVLPMLQALDEERPLSEAIERAIVGLTSESGAPRGCVFTRMRISSSRLGPFTAQRVSELQAEQLQAFEHWYQRGLDRGEANTELSPEFAARYFDTQLATVLIQMGEGVRAESIRQQARLALSVLIA